MAEGRMKGTEIYYLVELKHRTEIIERGREQRIVAGRYRMGEGRMKRTKFIVLAN